MAFTLAALTTELTTDPVGLGYAPLIAAGNDQGVADALNLVRPTITVPRPNVPTGDILLALVKAEWDALSVGDKQLVQAILSIPALDFTRAPLRGLLGALFPAGSTTLANLLALSQRPGSRAEQLFGPGAAVSHLDVARALGRG